MEATNNITEFLKTGSYFGIKIGMQKKLILKILHQKLEHSFSLDSCEGYYYHFAEIVFYNEKLQNIIISGEGIDSLFIEENTKKIKIRRNTTVSMIVKILKQANINWRFNKEVITDKSLGILSEGGVNILFDFTERPIIGKIII